MTDITITRPQLAMLKAAYDNKLGIAEFSGHGTGVGFMRANFKKTGMALVDLGLMSFYPHGLSYEITAAGRKAVEIMRHYEQTPK